MFWSLTTQHFIVEIVNKIVLFFYDQITSSIYDAVTMYRINIFLYKKTMIYN